MNLRISTATAALFWAGLVSPAIAQNGQEFDVQLVLKKCDCDARKAEVQVQVRAATAQKTFRMGDANFRFDYDSDKLRQPFLLSQDGFSPRSGDMNYNLQHLNGSSEGSSMGMVSLNTTYSGGAEGATLVANDWKGVATLRFDLAQLDQPINLRWHNSTQFPITGMSAVRVKTTNGQFDYDFLDVLGGNFKNLQFTPAVRCRNIAPMLETRTIVMTKNGTARENFNVIDPDVDDLHQISPLSTSLGNVTNLTVNERVAKLTYTAKTAFIGRDKVEATLCDMRGLCNTAIIPVRVVDALPNLSTLSLDLQAVAVGKQARLNWLNNSGPLNERFVVQKQLADGSFRDLGTLDGFAANTNMQSFVHIDANPTEGDNFYRIKLELVDGDVRFSEVKKVKFTNMIADIQLYPNPADSYTELDLTAFKGQHARMEVIDEAGRVVMQRDLGQIGTQTHQIDVTELASASYIVRVSLKESKKEFQKTMVVLR